MINEYGTDLREDKHYLMDHPGMLPVTTAQVKLSSCNRKKKLLLFFSIYLHSID
jgi:hypothetical protein